ncbi:MAG: GSU2403 family nucleotidyltransferase fold protein [Thermoleophilia bacterium]
MKMAKDYTREATERCERVLVTLLGSLGPWRDRMFLAGGLAPRYLVGTLPTGVSPHMGTTDVDLVVGLSLDEVDAEGYKTLERNLRDASFRQDSQSYRWRRNVDGVTVMVDLLCETDQVGPGKIFRPKEGLGSKLTALNVAGAQLAARDFIEVTVRAARLDNGGRSSVQVRVANLLPYVVLKINAFQDRHENKDAYDLIFCLRNYREYPEETGRELARSPVAGHPQVEAALLLLEERFGETIDDGPTSYAAFLGEDEDEEVRRRYQLEAVTVVKGFLAGFRA